ncbi:MAG: Asp-tRNA(Asn)/Glu-tRNA(Gln) amidotransferase subunit GatC [Patescibacteria group bacterium]|jgi:aspartyl-tRNA(Asn)/glutamyl-tRNA(Gln) amidotransferase subunit C
MKISQKEIEHIARLARLELTSADKKKYAGQLSEILDYIDQLKTVDTAGVTPTYQVTGLGDVSRADEIQPLEAVKAIKDNWPDRQGDYLKVPGVFDK